MYLKKQGWLYYLTGITAAITLPITILVLSIYLVTFDKEYYEKEFSKYHIGEVMSLNQKDLKAITGTVTEYLIGQRGNMDLVVTRDLQGGKQFFSDQDKAHMVDVREIFFLLRNLGIISAVLLAGALFYIFGDPRSRENIHRFLGTGAILGIVPFLALGILMMLDFEKYFLVFHEKFFRNDLWLMDPAVDNLVNIFPERFFYDMGIRICGGYIIGLLAVIVLSLSTIGKIRRDIK